MKEKLKTCKSVAKRIIVKKNFFARKKANKSHLLRRKTTKQLRQLSNSTRVHPSDESRFKLMIPYF